MNTRYKLTTTDPEGKKAHYSSIAKLGRDLGIEESTMRHKLAKFVGKTIWIKGLKIKVEAHDPEPEAWAISGGQLYTAPTLHAVSGLIGGRTGALKRRWIALGKPERFEYSGSIIGIGKYDGTPLSKPEKVEKPWRREVEYVEDRIAPRLGGLLSAGYSVHGMGMAGGRR
jgi:hypothetical protein